MTDNGEQGVYAQLVLGAAERERFAEADIVAKLGRARELARLAGLIFWPSGDARLDKLVRGRCRELGVELYLWLPVLADAGFEAADDELVETAWGSGGDAASGAWTHLGTAGETFRFACPLAPGQLRRVTARCRDELPDYDGVFLDRIRYPSPANGLESLFTCFCPRCLERAPELARRRGDILDLRRRFAAATDADLERWGTLRAALEEFPLAEFFAARSRILAGAVAGLVRLAHEMGKKAALDLFSPCLAAPVGQDYCLLGDGADWIKPMIYCHARGPAGLPLELACLARGLMAWGRFSEPAVMAFVARSFALPAVPPSVDGMERAGIAEAFAAGEFAAAAGDAACPVYPGFECVRHPDFDLNMDADGVRRYLAAFSGAAAVVPAWNLLYTPDDFLGIVAAGG